MRNVERCAARCGNASGPCNAGDYVELMAFQDSGGALNFGLSNEETFLAAWRIG